VYVVVEAPNDYAAACFRQYGMNTDASGRYSAMYKPFHMIGLELNVSVLAAALLGRATGSTRDFRGDVVATAKRDLAAGEQLDGEGGFTVYGKLLPAAASLAVGGLPIGLAHDVALERPVKAGELVRWSDVTVDDAREAVRARREMEARFAPDRLDAAE
jgi:predicted homoserine dehydrogenase-like protein